MSPRHRGSGRTDDRGRGLVIRNGFPADAQAANPWRNCAPTISLGCLRTPRGGSGRQIIFKAGQGEYHVRLLTPREAARLMGADDYTISVSLNQALFGFGERSACPLSSGSPRII